MYAAEVGAVEALQVLINSKASIACIAFWEDNATHACTAFWGFHLLYFFIAGGDDCS